MKNPNSPLHRAILEAWDCAFAGTPVAYLSGPITTGLRQIERVRTGDVAPDGKRAVIIENSTALIETAKQLRAERSLIIVEPGSLNIADWSQADYLSLWEALIERHVALIIFMPDWQYSIGCAIEFRRAIIHDIRTESITGAMIGIEDGINLLLDAAKDLHTDSDIAELHELADRLEVVAHDLRALLKPVKASQADLRKDASLDYLAEQGFNVAQFVSFSPDADGLKQEYARIAGHGINAAFENPLAAIRFLLGKSSDQSVNVRSYEPFNPQSRPFKYGIKSAEEALTIVNKLSSQGLYTIVNETVDVNDGGVSGVLMGNVLEFSPDDTPRCVEKPGTASLPRGWGRELLSTVYGFPVELDVPLASRLEFSLHPKPRGWKQSNILTWEYSEEEYVGSKPAIGWPNNFSKLIGDKTFGLLVAHHLGLAVPYTTVINRRIAPFSFGRSTGCHETWIRTAPVEQVPGKFTTHRGWIDPYALLAAEDPAGRAICSVLAQQGVNPEFSGALIVDANGRLVIEGKQGEGETLMLGTSAPEALPIEVEKEVRKVFEFANAALGPVRFEWVFDGKYVWVVQLHGGATESDAINLTQGEAETWAEFDVSDGLEALRQKVAVLKSHEGLLLKGRVGLTSHIADVLRKAKIPARMVG